LILIFFFFTYSFLIEIFLSIKLDLYSFNFYLFYLKWFIKLESFSISSHFSFFIYEIWCSFFC
jgi:hypothetical protein